MVVEEAWLSLDSTVDVNLVLWACKSWIDHSKSLVNCLNSLIGSVLQVAHQIIGHFSDLLVKVALLEHNWVSLSILNHLSVLGSIDFVGHDWSLG